MNLLIRDSTRHKILMSVLTFILASPWRVVMLMIGTIKVGKIRGNKTINLVLTENFSGRMRCVDGK